MVYIPDGTLIEVDPYIPPPLTVWQRLRRKPEPQVIDTPTHVRAFGCLDPGYSFPTGPVDPEVLKVLEFSLEHCHLWGLRCYRASPFGCPRSEKHLGGCKYVYEGGTRQLGSSCLVVLDEEGQVWAAPNLVVHYVRDIHYVLPFTPLPPTRDLVENLERRHMERNLI